MLKERLIVAAFCIFALICCAAGMRLSEKISVPAQQPEAESATSESYIKWVDFSPTYSALSDAMELDISTYKTQRHLSWIDTLSYLACKNGGNFSGYKRSQLDKLVEALGDDIAHRAQGSLGILAGQARLRGDGRAQFVLVHSSINPP